LASLRQSAAESNLPGRHCLLDQTSAGPFHLRQPELADLVVEAIHYNAFVLGHYQLHAFVVSQIMFTFW